MSVLTVPRRRLSLRSWATPLVVGSFLLMGATGVAMSFNMETPLMKGLHEWAGWAMLAAGGAHLVLNWRGVTTYIRRPLAGGIMGLGAVLLGLSLLPIAREGGPSATIEAMIGAVGAAPVTVLAELTGQEVAAGLPGAGPESTVAHLAAGDRELQFAGLAAVLAP